MKYACIAAAIAFVVGAHACHAQEGVDKAKATAFDTRMFDNLNTRVDFERALKEKP